MSERVSQHGLPSPAPSALMHAVAAALHPASPSLGNVIGRMLPTSQDVFEAMAHDMEGARREVLFQTFIWNDRTWPACRLRGALEALERRRSRPPVVVHLMVRHRPLVGVASQSVSALRRLIARLDPRYLEVQLWRHYERGFGALHSKSLVVDGERALITGANPQRGSDLPTPWADTGFALRGPIVGSLRQDLLTVRRCSILIASNGGPRLTRPPLVPPPLPIPGGVPMV
ncbi:MAG TPA: hypothetical protein VFH51_06280, partial [Myxococcota bacterium]|nr:hypothetical protein [Myxococcota bacterium]